jgi:hypothetical protein
LAGRCRVWGSHHRSGIFPDWDFASLRLGSSRRCPKRWRRKQKGDKPFRVRKAAYDIVLVARDGWLKSPDLRQTLESLDFPRKLHSVVIETGRSDHQRSFLDDDGNPVGGQVLAPLPQESHGHLAAFASRRTSARASDPHQRRRTSSPGARRLQPSTNP